MKYLIKNQALLRKHPSLSIEKNFTLDIPPTLVRPSTSHLSLFPKQKSVKPMNYLNSKQPYHQPLEQNLGNNSRTFKSGRRQLPSQQTSYKIQLCYIWCPTTGEWLKTIPLASGWPIKNIPVYHQMLYVAEWIENHYCGCFSRIKWMNELSWLRGWWSW